MQNSKHTERKVQRGAHERGTRFFFTSCSRLDVDMNNNRSKCKHRPGVNVMCPVLLPEVSTEHTWEQLGAVTGVTSGEFKGTWKAASTSSPQSQQKDSRNPTAWRCDQNKTVFWSETGQRRDKCMTASDDSRILPFFEKLGILMMQHSQSAFTCRRKFFLFHSNSY